MADGKLTCCLPALPTRCYVTYTTAVGRRRRPLERTRGVLLRNRVAAFSRTFLRVTGTGSVIGSLRGGIASERTCEELHICLPPTLNASSVCTGSLIMLLRIWGLCSCCIIVFFTFFLVLFFLFCFFATRKHLRPASRLKLSSNSSMPASQIR